ncbi:MAG: hypothetical protein K2P58_15285 [Hyphomonadaceae bacterium]|nr:hypothetical protein [Hyphomonadaceae bacterium]
MRTVYALVALALALAACATPAGPAAPVGSGRIPSTPIELGDWRHASEASTLSTFQAQINARYAAGLELSAVFGDLRRAEFTCAAGPARTNGRGDPPAQVCRRTITANGCTHTWQVHLFDTSGDARLARTRGLYDRRCGGDGLLGGPS